VEWWRWVVSWLYFICMGLLVAGSAHAAESGPPAFVAPATAWGGQLVQESVPYQPSVLFVPTESQQPILLDHLALPTDASLQMAALTTDAVPLAEELANAVDPQLPPGAREGVFQKMFFNSTWLPQFEGDSLGWSTLEAGLVFGFPLFQRDTPLLITPRFGVHFLDRPTVPDLPSKVYDASMEFRHLRKFGNGPWAMDVAVTLGYYSDFEIDAGQAFRVSGRGLAVYEQVSGRTWVFGVAYLNRAGVSVLPVGGVIFESASGVKWELIVPQPRVAWRLPGNIADSGDERWFYLKGELGGGIWSIERPASMTLDLLTYSDYRVMLGYERKIIGGLSRRFEVGYVFRRELEFDSATPDVSLDDSLMLRAGFTY
jgi:hypothetical protein